MIIRGWLTFLGSPCMLTDAQDDRALVSRLCGRGLHLLTPQFYSIVH